MSELWRTEKMRKKIKGLSILLLLTVMQFGCGTQNSSESVEKVIKYLPSNEISEINQYFCSDSIKTNESIQQAQENGSESSICSDIIFGVMDECSKHNVQYITYEIVDNAINDEEATVTYDERDFDSIIDFSYQNEKKAKKLINFYEKILKADDSEFINVEYGRKGILDGSKQYKQTTESSSYKYYGKMKGGLPDGQGLVVEYISEYGVYLPKVLGNFKKGQLDGYSINFSTELIFQVSSEGDYSKGEENGEHVIYSSKLLNYELGANMDIDVMNQYSSYIRQRKSGISGEYTPIFIDIPLTPVYISAQGKLKSGKMVGNWHSYYVNGTIRSEMKMDGESGKGTLYYMDGTVQYKGEIKNGEYHGKGTLYREDGSVEYKGKFKNGKIDN